jgi:hypothetical protein
LESNVILQSKWRFAPGKEASSEYLEYLSSVWLFYLEYPNPQTNQVVFGLPYSVASTLTTKKEHRLRDRQTAGPRVRSIKGSQRNFFGRKKEKKKGETTGES